MLDTGRGSSKTKTEECPSDFAIRRSLVTSEGAASVVPWTKQQ